MPADPSRKHRTADRGDRRQAIEQFVAGRGGYVGDIALPRMAELAFARSPVAHARIVAIDVAAAREVPGVLAVFTAEDLRGLGAQPRMWDLPGQRACEERALAHERLRHVGEPYAAVVACDRATAERAVSLIALQYEELELVLSLDAAEACAVRLYPEWPDNVVATSQWRSGDARAAMDGAATVVSHKFASRRVHPLSLETRGVVANIEADGCLTLHVSTQAPHQVRTAVSECLGIPEHRLRVKVPHVGGGFGMKAFAYPEETLVAWLALRLNRPVRWIEWRDEAFVASTHGRDEDVDLTVAFDAHGAILALQAKVRLDKGSRPYASSMGTAWVTGATLTGGYRVPVADIEAVGLVTNKTPTGAYRGFGQPEANLAMERVLDIAAARLGLAPDEIRRRNLLSPGELPHATPTGMVLDSGNYAELMKRTLDSFGFADARARAASGGCGFRRRGVGMACYTEMTNFGPSAISGIIGVRSGGHDSCTIRMEPSGHVQLFSGITSMGQGIEVALARICADVLTLPFEDIAVKLGDTDHPAYTAYGTGGSRGAGVGGGAAFLASRALAERIAKWGAHLLDIDEADVEIVQGGVQGKGSAIRRVSMAQVAAAAYLGASCPAGLGPGLEIHLSHDPAGLGISYGTVAVEVEVDMETGKVRVERMTLGHDCGVQIHPEIVAGQIYGAAVQAIGTALFEEIAYDSHGKPLASSLLDYLVPLASDVPAIDLIHMATPSPFSPHGAKGVGESGIIAVPAAIMNAVQHALGPSVTLDTLPMKPERVFEAIRQAGHSAQT